LAKQLAEKIEGQRFSRPPTNSIDDEFNRNQIIYNRTSNNTPYSI